MNHRFLPWVMRTSIVAAVVLTACPSWGVFYALGPSKDEWGLKYDVQLVAADSKTVNVVFTLTDEGRLKPVHSYTVVAFSLKTDAQGGRGYDVKAPLELQSTADGKRTAQVQVRREFIDRAMIRVLTLHVDGRRQTAGAAYYDIPLKKFINRTPPAAVPPVSPSVSVPPTTRVVK